MKHLTMLCSAGGMSEVASASLRAAAAKSGPLANVTSSKQQAKLLTRIKTSIQAFKCLLSAADLLLMYLIIEARRLFCSMLGTPLPRELLDLILLISCTKGDRRHSQKPLSERCGSTYDSSCDPHPHFIRQWSSGDLQSFAVRPHVERKQAWTFSR